MKLIIFDLCGAVLYLITALVILGVRLMEKRGSHE